MKKIILGIALIVCGASLASGQIIITIAGGGGQGYSGDGGPATAADLYYPFNCATDAAGNVYIADALNYRVRKVNTSGIISTFAGTGASGYNGDNIQATAAQLSMTAGVATDAAGNVYIGDFNNCRIRKVNTLGVITTVAGTGALGYGGDGGPATAAQLFFPWNLTVDGAGNIYFSDDVNYRVRKVTTAGIISTIAGNGTGGFSGDGGQATAAEVNSVSFVSIDPAGNIFLADDQSNRTRKINTLGVISTIAGTGAAGYNGDGIQATAASLYYSSGNGGGAIDYVGNIYIGDYGNNRIRKINGAGVISTIGGTGVAGFSGDGGQATAAKLNGPVAISIDAAGNIFVTDELNDRIRKIVGGAILPVTLTSFAANYISTENAVNVQWTASTQTNNKWFVVEKSTNCENWTEVETLPGAGTTSVSMNYSVMDNSPMASILSPALTTTDGVTLYYRLKQIDFDGHAAPFNPVAVTIIPNQNTLQVYPNPSSGKINVTVPGNFSQNATNTVVTVYNISGQVVYNETIQGNNTEFTLDLSSLPSSIYLMRVTGSNTTCQQKVLITH